MGAKTNFSMNTGCEIMLFKHYLLLPYVKINFPNESSKNYGEYPVVMDFGNNFAALFPALEYGLNIGYTCNFSRFISPYFNAGITYGVYQSDKIEIRDNFGIVSGNTYFENRIIGIPFILGNYFDLSKLVSIKFDLQCVCYFQNSYYYWGNNILTGSDNYKLSIGSGISLLFKLFQ